MRAYRILAILLIILGIILVILGLTLDVHAQEESDYGCPTGQVYRQYHCPSNPWEECDPYTLYAQADESFCEMIVYIEGHLQPYIREVYGQLCYPDNVKDGKHCMALYSSAAAVWTEGDAATIISIYVNSVFANRLYLPMLNKELR